jgi:hypothetical protein
MIFSEFHRYWTNKIKNLSVEVEYKTRKISELSRAFYTLKISHDQLEKNYVIKPMSIRNSIEFILNKNSAINDEKNLDKRIHQTYVDFLELLEKSFNVSDAIIVYTKDEITKRKNFIGDFEKGAQIVSANKQLENSLKIEDILEDYMVDKALSQKRPVYLSNELGEPSIATKEQYTYLAAIPSVYEDKLLGILLIKKISFMAFNKENLTAISILLDYFMIEIENKALLLSKTHLPLIEDKEFNVEFTRLEHIYTKYKVNSVTLAIKTQNQLQATRLYELIDKILRSLDLVTMVEHKGFYNIAILFALNDKAAAKGFLNRLVNNIPTKEDKDFDYMIFNMTEIDLLNEYIKKEYDYDAK